MQDDGSHEVLDAESGKLDPRFGDNPGPYEERNDSDDREGRSPCSHDGLKKAVEDQPSGQDKANEIVKAGQNNLPQVPEILEKPDRTYS
jgi:hypothetical protein